MPTCNLVESSCHTCGHTDFVTVDASAYQQWLDDPHCLVQMAFPQLTTDEREVLIGSRSGFYLCDGCWAEDFDE